LKVHVRYVGLFAKYVGERDRDFDLPDSSTADDLLARLADQYVDTLPANFRDLETGRLHRSVRLARASGAISNDEPLEDGDNLLVLFTLAGG
jgi:molybdopterin converting factor small subunit